MRFRKSAAALAALALSAGLSACCLLPKPPPAPQPPPADSPFGALDGLVGKTWRSVAVEEGESGPADISQWGRDLGGRVLVNRHVLEDGSYGGLTYIYENAQTGSLDYVYVTSGGFHTSGTFELGPDGSWTAEEEVTGHETITRVRSTGRITPDGYLSMTSEYFANGEWQPGRNVVYGPTTEALPQIRKRHAE
jgi:hypothetical protein